MSQEFWSRCLWVAVGGVAIFSTTMTFAPALLHDFYATLIYGSPDDLITGEAMPYIEFMYVVLGAVMLGWVISIAFLVRQLSGGNQDAWLGIAISMGVWFMVDSGLSLYLGFWQNALMNVPFFILFAVPLVALKNSTQA